MLALPLSLLAMIDSVKRPSARLSYQGPDKVMLAMLTSMLCHITSQSNVRVQLQCKDCVGMPKSI